MLTIDICVLHQGGRAAAQVRAQHPARPAPAGGLGGAGGGGGAARAIWHDVALKYLGLNS